MSLNGIGQGPTAGVAVRVDPLQPAQMDATRAIIEAALTAAPMAPTPEYLGRCVDLYA